MQIHPVILCGGNGSRLWPLSRKSFPKQFLTLFDNHSLLQETVIRVNHSNIFSPPIIVTNIDYKHSVKSHLKQLGINNYSLMLEPFGKNTAPAAAMAALFLRNLNQDAVMLVVSSDHYITKKDEFIKTIQSGVNSALEGYIVTFGMTPTFPHTGYGYIYAQEQVSKENNMEFRVEQFVEKPTKENAIKYLTSGKYSWNSGIFMMKASIYLDELKKFRPDIYKFSVDTFKNSIQKNNEVALNKEIFANCPAESIDYAVMEKTTLGRVLKTDIGWSDVGSWDTVWEISTKDSNENTLIGNAIVEKCQGSYFYNEDKRLLATVGLNDTVVVQTSYATLVLHKSFAQDIKNIVSQLEKEDGKENDNGTKVFRPWGNYEVYADEPHFKVKRIVIAPGGKLSLQSHNYRAEHWIVVKGIARVTKGNEEFDLYENESTFIQPKEIHRLENKQTTDLYIIEVQTGSYFGEDDIIRYEDIYGRSS